MSDTFLFIGDSITDAGRDYPNSLGEGYVSMIKKAMPDKNIINRGISGDRVFNIARRLKADCIDHNPHVVTILVGINDCARRYDSGDMTDIKTFGENYRSILERIKDAAPKTKIILMEPFLLPLLEYLEEYREDLDPKIHTIRKLSLLFRTHLIPLDGIMAQSAALSGYEKLTYDGVHLHTTGHKIIADAWLDYYNSYVK